MEGLLLELGVAVVKALLWVTVQLYLATLFLTVVVACLRRLVLGRGRGLL